jgi:hypothetical protein
MNTAQSTMRIIPSMPAAFITGAVIIPICGLGWRFFETTYPSQLLLILWVILTFMVPVLLATADIHFIRRYWRETGVFRMRLPTADDFRRFYFPAWCRMLVLFIAAVTSDLVLRLFGIVL